MAVQNVVVAGAAWLSWGQGRLQDSILGSYSANRPGRSRCLLRGK